MMMLNYWGPNYLRWEDHWWSTTWGQWLSRERFKPMPLITWPVDKPHQPGQVGSMSMVPSQYLFFLWRSSQYPNGFCYGVLNNFLFYYLSIFDHQIRHEPFRYKSIDISTYITDMINILKYKIIFIS